MLKDRLHYQRHANFTKTKSREITKEEENGIEGFTRSRISDRTTSK